MSRADNGGVVCDRCGRTIPGNGAVTDCAVISDVHPVDPGQIVNYNLCRDYPDPDDPDKTIKGCAPRVLTKTALAAWHEAHDVAAEQAAVAAARQAASVAATPPDNPETTRGPEPVHDMGPASPAPEQST